jgi:hypothetical protein
LGDPEQSRRPLDVVHFYDPIAGVTTELSGFAIGGRGHDAVVWTGEEAVLVHQNVIMREEWTVLAFTPPG